MAYSFEVNRCLDDYTQDELHQFKSIGEMRKFIDLHPCYPMEVTVYENGEQIITLCHATYWQGEKHPTLKQLIS